VHINRELGDGIRHNTETMDTQMTQYINLTTNAAE